MPSLLEKVISVLKENRSNVKHYQIPSVWAENLPFSINGSNNGLVSVNPYDFFISALELSLSPDKNAISAGHNGRINFTGGKGGDWLAGANIYGLYVRSFTAFDHDQNGILGGSRDDITLSDKGFRETGTFLKTIALLPLIKKSGFDTIYLLPVSMTGHCHAKGELGSPYSVKNPRRIDPILADPLLPGIEPEEQFGALVESAHNIGLRVVLDFVFRTAARDSDYIRSNPGWFYWIENIHADNFKKPVYSPGDLEQIRTRFYQGDPVYIAPGIEYTRLFRETPDLSTIRINDDGSYTGLSSGRESTVPGAFADFPPDDPQPSWDDVTYLRLFTDPDFNYMAYNTIRVYDPSIRNPNQALWEELSGIIPFYQDNFGIDGARIDMAHALPPLLEKKIITEARDRDPDFGFISEEFDPHVQCRDTGYNIVHGNSLWALPRFGTADQAGRNFTKAWITGLPRHASPVLGSPETPDSPRAATRRGGIRYSEAAWFLVCTLPNVVPYCLAGLEMGERLPMNTGLDFTPLETEALKEKSLAFYNRGSLNWVSPLYRELISKISFINHFRRENLGILTHLDNFHILDVQCDGLGTYSPGNPIIAYVRGFQEEFIDVLTTGIFGGALFPVAHDKEFLVIINMDFENEKIATVKYSRDRDWTDLENGKAYRTVDGELNIRLKPGEIIVALGNQAG